MILVNIKCDGCGEIIENVIWQHYKRQVHKNGEFYCLKCAKNGYKKYVSFEEWCYKYLPRQEAIKILSRWDYDLNIDKKGKQLTPNHVSYSSGGFNKKGYWFKCLEHSEHESELKNISSFTSGLGSFSCNQCNSISITYPYLISSLVEEKDAYKYSIGTNRKILAKCPSCGYEKEININDLRRQGFGCPRCGDGISYPQKIIFNVLEQINLDFKTELTKTTFSWCNNYKYDFYINYVNGIVETHGLQHYEDHINGSWRMSLQDIQQNDKNKEQLAKNNNINNYIILDCRKSELEWIKNNIMKSELPTLLNFKEEDIDWLKCHEFACSSLVKKVCEMWNDGLKNTTEIANIIKMERHTVVRYLKQGVKLGFCNYNSNVQYKNNLTLIHKKHERKIICLTTGEIFDSIKQASLKYKIDSSGLSACCRGKRKSIGKHQETGEPLKWMYYDKYIKNQISFINEELSQTDSYILLKEGDK